MKFVILLFVLFCSNIFGSQIFDFADSHGEHWRLCSLTPDTVLHPQSDIESECQTFIKNELAQMDLIFDLFILKSAPLKHHRFLVLFTAIDSAFKPVGMGEFDIIEEVFSFLYDLNKRSLKDKFSSFDCGYSFGGALSKAYQGQGIAKRIAKPCSDIMLTQIFPHRLDSHKPLFLIVATEGADSPMNQIYEKIGCERINVHQEGMGGSTFDDLNNQYIYHYKVKG